MCGMITTSSGNVCPLCAQKGIVINSSNSSGGRLYSFTCPNCGQYFGPEEFIYQPEELKDYHGCTMEQVRQYTYYHRQAPKEIGKIEVRPVFCEAAFFKEHVLQKYQSVYNISPEIIQAWYPQNFSEKIDKVLLLLAKKSVYDGAYVNVSKEERELLFFISNKHCQGVDKTTERSLQADYICEFLEKHGFCNFGGGFIQLTPKALDRVYELQKNNADNDRAFVAIQFDDTQDLRERIREGLQMAGYQAIIMDEKHYNGQIVPEMLHQINTCNFVVAELTSKNQNVYFEAGYATGQNKEVIYLCNGEKLDTSPQFDVAQYNLLTYETIDEIPQKLKARIEATIGRR